MSNYFFNQIPANQKRLTLATCFTLLRIILSPLLVVCMKKGWLSLAFLVFVVGALSDMLDGFFARLRNEQTLLGACLDPIADKIFIISSFAALAFVKMPARTIFDFTTSLPAAISVPPTTLAFAIPRWFVWFLLAKELMLIAGIVIVYCAGIRIDIKPTFLSKATTTLQLFFISLLFIAYFFNWLPDFLTIVSWLFGVVVLMTGASLLHYAYIGFFMRKYR